MVGSNRTKVSSCFTLSFMRPVVGAKRRGAGATQQGSVALERQQKVIYLLLLVAVVSVIGIIVSALCLVLQ